MSRGSDNPILYLGDESLSSAAAYLAGIMQHHGLRFDYIPSHREVGDKEISGRRLFILSDYCSKRMGVVQQAEIVRQVGDGSGLLMIGGWESFRGGCWADTELGRFLPVEISARDDRVNCDQPALLRRVAEHPIVDGLPWAARPPAIGGFNRFVAKRGTTVLLEVERFEVQLDREQFGFRAIDRSPLLVLGTYGQGRTVALATDLAPHWVGGLVDWGEPRLTAVASGAPPIEVGAHYARFAGNLVAWTAKMGLPS